MDVVVEKPNIIFAKKVKVSWEYIDSGYWEVRKREGWWEAYILYKGDQMVMYAEHDPNTDKWYATLSQGLVSYTAYPMYAVFESEDEMNEIISKAFDYIIESVLEQLPQDRKVSDPDRVLEIIEGGRERVKYKVNCGIYWLTRGERAKLAREGYIFEEVKKR